MSGGSYDYICYSDSEDLVNKQEQIQRMADRLAELGYAPDAAKETENLLLTIRAFHNRLTTMHDRLADIFKAVEWWDSCDSGEEGVKKALAKYREEGKEE